MIHEGVDRAQCTVSSIRQRMQQAAAPNNASEVARMTCSSRETVRRYLTGGRPSVEFVVAFCRAFDVNPTWLLFGTGPRLLSSQTSRSPVEHDATELVAELHRLLSGGNGSSPS